MRNTRKTKDGTMGVELENVTDDWVTNLDIWIVLELGYQAMLRGFRRMHGAPTIITDDVPPYRDAFIEFICRKELGRSQIVNFIENAAKNHRLNTH